MQVKEITNEGLRREYSVVIAAADIEAKVADRINELAGTIKLPGFRPGKVPVSLLRKRYGPTVTGEVLEKSVRDSSTEALNERSVRPAMQPKIEVVSYEEGADLEYKMEFEILPDIEPIDFASLAFERPVAEVGDSEVDEAVTRLAEGNKSYAPIDKPRASKTGDQILIDFDGTVDGESREGLSAEDFALDLGAGLMIPGFEEQLTGAKAGDEKTVEVSFPEDYGVADLAGKPARFEVKVKEVREAGEPVIDDEFAKRAGAESLEDMRAKVRARMEQQYAGASRDRLKRALLDRLAEEKGFDLPASMVDQEFEAIWQQVQHQREHHPDDAEFQRPEEELKAEYQDIAARRVRIGLILSDVGRSQEIAVTQDELSNAVMTQARQYPGQEKEVFEYYRKNPQALEQLRAPILEDKVVDYILELAKVEDRTVSVEELLRDPDAEGGDGDGQGADEAAGKKKAAKSPAAKKSASGKKTSTKSRAKSKASAKDDG